MSATSGAAASFAPQIALGFGRRILEVLAVSAIGGLVLGCGMRWVVVGPLVGVGYALLLAPAVIERWRAPVLGFLPGLLAAIIVNIWTLRTFAWYVPILLGLLMYWHYVLAAVFARILWRATRWPAFVVLPLAQAVGELSRPLGLGNCNMFGVANHLYPWTHFIQAADLVGGTGLGAFWMIPCGLLIDVLRAFVDGDRTRLGRTLLTGGALSAAVLAAIGGYGIYRLSTEQIVEGPRLGILQPNLDHDPAHSDEAVRIQVRTTAERIPSGAADLVVWPENSIVATYERRPDYQKAVKTLVQDKGVPLLFGAQRVGPDGRRLTTSALLVDTSGDVVAHYDKVVLFPFTERRVAPVLEKIFPWLSNQLVALTRKAWREAPDAVSGPAAEPIVGELAGRRWSMWTPLCYESGYANLGRDAAQRGADFFVNLTAEGWCGWAASHNQMGVNILRAVENRVGLVRVGNTGPSGFFLPTGAVDVMLRGDRTGQLRRDSGVLVHTVKTDPRRGRTLYSRSGGFIDALWVVTFVGACLVGISRRKRERSA